MFATKAYILKIDTSTSHAYSKICAASCNSVGLPYEYFNGFQNMNGRMALAKIGIKTKVKEEYKYIEKPRPAEKAMCCTAGHIAIWQKIANGQDEAAVILEHDAVMLQPITVPIPDKQIVVLGYKVEDPSKYNHVAAGIPQDLISISGHEGAHAYAMTRNTAKILLKELHYNGGVKSAVDNDYFIKNQRKTSVPLCIMSPTPAVGWIRHSTIWGKSATRNYEFIPSFQENYK